ncbi:hypothetical protein ACFSKU_19010 [Pontibacter silvestris]|uniref:DUF4168 domain-containing protein n=1 Tax=Pontibacter silvestris TaxID=2305183 RepID=A0ABW4X1Y0_9BACT|nr:hypothetical protein [Pontibacter silvestris]MCC9135017.1 hypothetical protein [Pontibacter silvestris]
MKKITVAIFFALATTATFAQAPKIQQGLQTTAPAEKTLEQRAKEITVGMAKNLRLTPEQTAKVGAVNLSSMQSAEDAQKKYKADPAKIVQQMDIINYTRLSQLKDILTPQQFTQYQSRREEKMGVPREARSNPAARQQSSAYQEY